MKEKYLSWNAIACSSLCVMALLAFQIGCAGTEEVSQVETGTGIDFENQPKRIKVQHILIGFEGSVPRKNISRSKEEAEELAKEIYNKAKSGSNFDALVKQYTDDSHPGIYKMVNFPLQGDRIDKVFARGDMVPVFGDVGFNLKVGEVGLGEYSPSKSKYGWHIIKRLE